MARLERRREWAAGRRDKAAKAFAAAHRIASAIPFGQPILVGHHSERHARRDADRIGSNMDKGCECQDMAAHHESKAAGIAFQLERSIFSDDPDAVEAIKAKVAAGRAELEMMKRTNAAWRKDGEAGLVALGWTVEKAQRAAVLIAQAYSWEKQPFPKWQISNLGANMRRLEKRIEEIERMNRRKLEAEQAGGMAITGTGEYVNITFAEKPADDILEALRGAGFYWGQGCWSGYRSKIPTMLLPQPTAEVQAA